MLVIGYRISAKGYALYKQSGKEIHIEKARGHGLGYLICAKRKKKDEETSDEKTPQRGTEAWDFLLRKCVPAVRVLVGLLVHLPEAKESRLLQDNPRKQGRYRSGAGVSKSKRTPWTRGRNLSAANHTTSSSPTEAR
jgi:hypothetical protein